MKTLFTLTAAALLASAISTANAHISVSGDRTFNGGAPMDGLTLSNTTRTVSSGFGWADATDDTWGDSHRLRAFRFTIGSTQDVTIQVGRRNDPGQSGAFDTLLPAFSLFTLSGTFVDSTHDGSSPTVNYLTGLFGSGASAESFTDLNTDTYWQPGEPFTDANGNGVYDGAGLGGSGKEGAFRALAPWKIYNDGGEELFFSSIVGHIADGTSANYGTATGINGDGVADGFVSATFTGLAGGTYYLFVGGANYAAQHTDFINLPPAPSYKTYGITVSVSAIPEPGCVATIATGSLLLAGRRIRPRRR